MPTPRAATVTTLPPVLTNPTYTSPAMTGLAGMLSDRQTLLFWNAGFSAGQLGVSADGGATITYGKDLGGGSFLGTGLIETAGGEVLGAIRSRDGSAAGQVWRSTGWNKATAQATSWTKVLTCSGPAAYPDGRWCFTQRSLAPDWSARPGALFICEYGAKVSEAIAAGRASSTAATKAWMSLDDGVTWTVIFDLRDRYAAGLNAGLHVHGIAYDPWDDRVIITTGDGGLGDGGGTAVWYIDGEKLGDLTAWTAIPGTAGTAGTTQVTTVVPMETCVLLVSDGGTPGGIRRVARRGWRRYGDFVTVAPIGNAIIGAHAWQNRRPGSPLLLTYYQTSTTPAAPASIIATTDGVTFTEAHRESTNTASNAPGISPIMGPDVNGKVYAIRNLSGTGDLLTAEYAPAITF